MDPNTLPTPKFNMPQPPSGVASQPLNPSATAMPTSSPAGPPQSDKAPTDQSAALPVSQAPKSAPSAPKEDALAAADADLIEKEWVQKAKAIVERTRQDPYQQNKEITKTKADYLKKRYNKVIKVTDE